MAVPEGDKCTQSDSQSPFPMTTCPAPPALQPDTDPSLAATKPSTTSTALITYHSTEIVLFSSHLLEPKAISSAYTPSTLHNLEEPIPPRNQWERPIHPQYQIILQRPSTTPEPTRNYTAVIIVAILILRNVLQQQSTIRALRKWLAILMQWIRRLNPDAGYGVGVFNHTRLIPESEHMEKEKLEPMVMGPAKPHVSDFGGEIVVPDGSVGMEETDPISPLKLDEPSSARTEDLRVTSQVAEESQLSSLSGGEISSQDVCVERIDISTCSSVDIGSFEGVYSATVLLEEEIEPPNDQYLLSPVFSNPLESSKNAITCSISDEENRSTAVSRDIIEDQYNRPKNDNENTFQGKNEKSMLLLESIDLEVEHTNGEEYHDSGEASQFPIPKGRLPHAGDVSPPRTAAEIFPRPEDAISVPCSGGLNDGGVTSNSREEKTFSVTPIDTESISPSNHPPIHPHAYKSINTRPLPPISQSIVMPSPATLADQGSKALNSQNYAQAIDLYTQALRQTPESPDYYLKRSTAYQRSSNYASALRDAELAVVLANKRGKRELIGVAQLRRGISLLMEGKLGDAGFCFNEAEKKASNDKDKNLVGIWKGKLEMQLAKVDEDDITREVTVKEIPDVEIPKVTSEKKDGQTGLLGQTVAQAVTPPIAHPKGVVTPPSKIRHEWYQTATHIVITIYVKGVPKDEATVEIKNTSLSIAFPLPSGPEFTFDLDPLLYPVKADKSSCAILPTKIEIKLEKQIPGQKWGDLEASEATQGIGTIPLPTTSATPTSMAKVDLPLYPTSSKSGPKDWDKVAKDLTRSKKNKDVAEGEAVDAEEGGEYDSEAESGDPVNHFFKKLYKDADEDTRRAMMKSYVESNGTALSTNWKEVGKAPVETSPPEGMVAHKWDS